MILWVMTVNQMLKHTRLGHTPLGLTVRDFVCQAIVPMKRRTSTMAISSHLGVACEEIISLKDRKWWYKGIAQKKGFGGKETVWCGWLS